MKKIMLISVFFISLQQAFSQGLPPMDDERMQSLRIAFLTEYLNLTPEESQKFWPVYNQMRDEIKVWMDKEAELRKGKNMDQLSDTELNKMIESHFENDQQILNIKKKYAEEFKKILPLKKVALLADAENEFKRKLLEFAKDKKGPGGPGGGKPGGGKPF